MRGEWALARLLPIGATLAVAATALLSACAGSGDKRASPSTSIDAYGERNAVTVPGNAVTVELKNLQFIPQGIKVKPGTTVTWVNHEPVVHNVSQVNSVFTSQDEMRQEDIFTFTFTKPGVYRYQCTYHHPTMNGVVIVEG